MKKVLCRFCGTRDHHPSEMHLCKAMKREAIKPALLDGPHAPRDEKPARKMALPKPVDIAAAPTRSYTAEKQHRYRERKKATDPNYLSRESMRVRELREAMKRQQA